MFQWFLWDFDGTLFDTYPAINQAFLESLAVLGVTEDPQETMARLKVRQGPTITYFAKKHSLSEDRLAEEFEKRQDALAHDSPVFPEALELCRKIWERGSHNLLYTHRNQLAWELMQKAGLARWFEGGVTSENGFPSKPAPDAIQFLLKKFAIPPEQAVMVGDRLIDAQAGLNAGIAGCLWKEDGPVPDFSGIQIQRLSQLEAFIPAGK